MQSMKQAPFLCRRGYHTWRFTHMTNVRRVDAGAHSEMLCELVELCIRCNLSRTRYFDKVPKRVKV